MKTPNSVTGSYAEDAARLFPDFAYRKAIPVKVSVRSLDPARLNFMLQYPRSTKLVMPDFREVTIADWRINIGDAEDNGTKMITVELLANQYTASPKDRVIFAMRVSAYPHITDFEGYTDAIARRAIEEWKRPRSTSDHQSET